MATIWEPLPLLASANPLEAEIHDQRIPQDMREVIFMSLAVLQNFEGDFKPLALVWVSFRFRRKPIEHVTNESDKYLIRELSVLTTTNSTPTIGHILHGHYPFVLVLLAHIPPMHRAWDWCKPQKCTDFYLWSKFKTYFIEGKGSKCYDPIAVIINYQFSISPVFL